ncbi:MAG: M20/M25/M40 family metallo-hydrolase [Pseudomonadales bacterium]
MQFHLSMCSALLLLCVSPLANAELDSVERQIVDAVDARQGQALDLLERAVNINSGSLNLEGVRAVGQLFDAALRDAGLETEWIDGAAFGRAGHLIARTPGQTPADPRPHVLLIGHLDTVFEPDSPFQRFERLDGDGAPGRYARGPGSTDMKGGDVVIVEALQALRRAGVLDRLQVTVVLIGDEELSGRPLSLARAALVAAAEDADVALGFEDGDGDPATAVIARRGYSGWELSVRGTPAHSSLIFSDAIGAGAIYEVARILDGFYTTLAGEPNLTFNPGVLLAGTSVDFDAEQARGSAFGKANVVPEHAVVSGDLRTLSMEQRERAKLRMQEIVAAHLPGTSAELRFEDGYPPLAPSDGNRRLLDAYSAVSEALGYGPVAAVDPAAAGAADISFTAGRVDMALDGLGLMGSGGHTVTETADLDTLGSQTQRAAVLMYRLKDLAD